MEVFTSLPRVPFMKLRFVAAFVSLSLIAISVFAWIKAGDNRFGVDFLGGIELVVGFDSADVDASKVRSALSEGGFPSAVVQNFQGNGNGYSIRLKAAERDEVSSAVQGALNKLQEKPITIHKQDFVGPTIGKQIRADAFIAILLSLVGILIYVSVRFELRFAVGAVLALAHDVIISAGMVLLSGGEISAGVLAALLTIVGYSINDTIIVFDRIRENIGKEIKKAGAGAKNTSAYMDYSSIIDASVNETLSRTVLTSLTVFFVVLALWLMGGAALADLAFTLLVGVIVGSYSSIFIASPLILVGVPAKKE